MERKFLEDLGMEKEIINQIMAEHGKNIQDLQKKISDVQEENQQLKNDNSTYQKTIEKFKDIKPDEMQQTINDLKNQIQENENKYKQDLADRDFNSFIDNGLNEAKARDVRAVKALLDIDLLKNSKNQNEDFKKAVEELKQNKSFLFESNEPIDNVNVGGSQDTPPNDVEDIALRNIFGIKEKK